MFERCNFKRTFQPKNSVFVQQDKGRLSNREGRFYLQGDESCFFQVKAQHCPVNKLIKINGKCRKALLTISEILEHLSIRTKRASEKCNEHVGNDCPALRIPVGSNPLAPNKQLHRLPAWVTLPSQRPQGLSTQHRLGQAGGGWEGPQEEGEQWGGRRKPWNNPKSPSQRPAATDRDSEQSPGGKQLANRSKAVHAWGSIPATIKSWGFGYL